MFRRLSSVIFDLDGTLVDTNRLYRSAWQQAASERGFEITDSLYALMVGRHSGEIRKILQETHGVEFPYEEILSERVRIANENLREHGVGTRPGAMEVLEFLVSKGIPTGVATTTEREVSEYILERCGLRKLIQAVVGGDEVAKGKPAPDVYLEAARRLSAVPRNSLSVEDTSPGVDSGVAAGMHCVLIPDLQEVSDATRGKVLSVLPSLHSLQTWINDNLSWRNPNF